MDTDVQSEEQRVLLVVPTARDEEITRSLLTKAGVTCVVCENLNQLVKEVRIGAGAILLTEEATNRGGYRRVSENVRQTTALVGSSRGHDDATERTIA